MSQTIKVGRRKTAVARVFINPAKSGQGSFIVNGRTLENYFPVDILRMIILEPFTVLNKNAADYAIQANIAGGGIKGQAEALRHGIARLLDGMDTENHGALKRKGLLTRDSRMVERKKFGRRKARRRFQFSKR